MFIIGRVQARLPQLPVGRVSSTRRRGQYQVPDLILPEIDSTGCDWQPRGWP